jgi:hypothetical protein
MASNPGRGPAIPRWSVGVFIAIGFLLFFFSTLLTRQRGTDSGCELKAIPQGKANIESCLAPQSQSIDFELRVVLEKAHRALRSPFTQFTGLMMSPFFTSMG